MIGGLLDALGTREAADAALLFARLPWPVRRLVGYLRVLIGRLRLSREHRAWVREMEEEDRRANR